MAAPELCGNVLGGGPRLASVGAAAYVAADGVALGRGKESVASHKDAYNVAVVAHHEGGIAEAVLAAGALGDGDGLTPCEAVVGAAARDDVDVFGQVGLVVFAAVAGDEECAVGQAADGGDAPIGAAIVAGTEEALLVVLDGIDLRRVNGVVRLGFLAAAQENKC